VAIRTSRRVSHNNHSACQKAITNNARFAVIFARVFDFQCGAGKYNGGIVKIESAFRASLLPFGRIEGDANELL
jgi:hypothetical protein